jgi:hypothetical protein
LLPVRKLTAPKNARDPGDSLTTVDQATPTPAVVSVRFDRGQLVLGGIVVAQAIWLWILIGRGWFLQADFSNLADGMGRPLTWSYLREPLGGHFAPVLRLLYWLLDRIGPLDHSLTVGFRVVLQAASTILLYRVLRLLVGRSNLALAVIGLYAFSPLLLAGLAWLTSGLGLVLGQVFALLAIETHLRFGRTRDLRFAVATGVLLALATLSADQWIVIAFSLPILSAAYVYQGTIRERLRSFVAHWRAWTATLLPLGGVVALALTLGDSAGAHSLSATTTYRLVRDDWLKSVGPSLVGGHWRWFADQDTYLPFYAPSDAVVLLGQFAFVVLLLVGLQRTGWLALVGWSLPIVIVVANMCLVGTGRFETYGSLLAITPRYSFVVAAPLAIGVALSLCRPVAPANAASGLERPRYLIAAALVAAVGLSSMYSGIRFTHYWAKNPSKAYVDALLASGRAAGSDLNIYDTALPPDIVSKVEPHHRIADVLRLGGLKATYEDPRSEPLVASTDGHLVKSVFVPASVGLGELKVNCGTYIHGTGTWTIPMSKPVPVAEWYLRFELYQRAASTISVELTDAAGSTIYPVQGTQVEIGGTLAAINLRLPASSPIAVKIRSTAASTSLCLVRTIIGGPFATAK